MEAPAFSTAHLDYLQRTETVAPPAPELSWTVASAMRLSRVAGVGRFARHAPVSQRPRPPTEDLLTGLHGRRVPVAFLVGGAPSRVSLQFATWVPAHGILASAEATDARHGLLTSLLAGLYPTVDFAPGTTDDTGPPSFTTAGLALGMPSPRPTDPADPTTPMDRLIRAMGGAFWAVLVLAQPVEDSATVRLRRSVINELRAVQTEEKDKLAPSPLGRHYGDLLGRLLEQLTAGHGAGAWRTAAYLFGDALAYHRLAGVWRAIFAGEDSCPEPLRVWDLKEWPFGQRAAAAGWAMPDGEAPPGPGLYRRPFAHQTLLTSGQLANYVHLPAHECPGFAVTTVAAFDTVRRPAAGPRPLRLGRVMHLRRLTDEPYQVDAADLARHALVAGVTGSGKTTTLLHLLGELDGADVPFLVIEPAKAEYRALLEHPVIGSRLRVFTPGDERIAPFRLNPFEVPVGINVAQHLDLLRAVFAAGFAMWTPLPQTLEQCLHEVYADRGWNLATGENTRLGRDDDRTLAAPTLSDLVAKVDEVVPRLGYEQRISDDIRAALVTRLNALRAGAKGRMLDVRRSIPMDQLLASPTVLELEWMGDDDDKAFVMALLLVRLAEHRRAEGQSRTLRHVLLIEEAHRVLAAVLRHGGEESADPRAKAVETFTQLLTEIRAYGQGVVVADQVPIRLAPDVLKNTGLKLAHRTVAADDRAALAATMAMDEPQAEALITLANGEAAVFGVGDDAPVLVQMPAAEQLPRPNDADVATRMATWRSTVADLFAPAPFCKDTCTPAACSAARALTAVAPVQRTFARLVLSMIEDPAALERLWPDLVTVIRARRPPEVQEDALLRALAGHLTDWLAARRGTQAHWSYADTGEFAARLRASLLENLDARAHALEARAAFRALAQRLHERSYEPYPACAAICDQATPPLCLYRHWLADLVGVGRYRQPWHQAQREDIARPDLRRLTTWQVCQDAAYEAIEWPEDDWSQRRRAEVAASARRAALCFSQQMLADEPKVPRSGRRILARIIQEAGL